MSDKWQLFVIGGNSETSTFNIARVSDTVIQSIEIDLSIHLPIDWLIDWLIDDWLYNQMF